MTGRIDALLAADPDVPGPMRTRIVKVLAGEGVHTTEALVDWLAREVAADRRLPHARVSPKGCLRRLPNFGEKCVAAVWPLIEHDVGRRPTSIPDQYIDTVARKLRDAYHNDLTDCPVLLDAAEMLLTLKAERRAAQ